jgi:hypothetical protein
MHTHDSFNALLRGELAATETYQQALVRTENVVARPDSAAKAFVDAGGASPADAGSLSTFLWGDKWEEGRRFFPLWVPKTSSGGRINTTRAGCDVRQRAYATRA